MLEVKFWYRFFVKFDLGFVRFKFFIRKFVKWWGNFIISDKYYF